MGRLLVFALALTLSATGAWADRYDDCSQSKDLDLTVRACTQIIKRGKRESQKYRVIAYHNRGVAYDGKGEYDRAIADYTKAIELNPKYTEAYDGRGNAYKDKGEYDRAIADYTKAIELDPKYYSAYNNRGVAYEGKGEYDRAIADYRAALANDPAEEDRQALETALKRLGDAP